MEKHVNTDTNRRVTCKNKCVPCEKSRVKKKRKFFEIPENTRNNE